MMSYPVFAICLTADRQKLTDRAVKCFASQTYKNKGLIILDTGIAPYLPPEPSDVRGESPSLFLRRDDLAGQSIGKLRNFANDAAFGLGLRNSILMHWDSDDWSSPNRMAEQVEVLAGADEVQAVGYNQMPFWDSAKQETWLYSNPSYAIGTSLCYWGREWRRHQFEDVSKGEDTRWQRHVQCFTLTALGDLTTDDDDWNPQMIAHVHGGNTIKNVIQHDNREWTRAAHLDEFCSERMEF